MSLSFINTSLKIELKPIIKRIKSILVVHSYAEAASVPEQLDRPPNKLKLKCSIHYNISHLWFWYSDWFLEHRPRDHLITCWGGEWAAAKNKFNFTNRRRRLNALETLLHDHIFYITQLMVTTPVSASSRARLHAYEPHKRARERFCVLREIRRPKNLTCIGKRWRCPRASGLWRQMPLSDRPSVWTCPALPRSVYLWSWRSWRCLVRRRSRVIKKGERSEKMHSCLLWR